MRKFYIVLLSIFLFSVCQIDANAGATATSGTVTTAYFQGGNAFAAQYTATSDGAGNAVFWTDDIVGKIVQWFISPSQTAGQTPTNLFDVTLTDIFNVDVLRADGANLTSGSITAKYESDSTKLPIQTIGRLTCAASNMGSTKTLTLQVYYKYD